MTPHRKPFLALSALAVAGVLTGAPPAAASKPWAIELETSLEATSNIQQLNPAQAGTSLADAFARTSLEFSYFPLADGENSAALRLQALDQRFYYNPDFNSTFLIGTALGSRRLWNGAFGYGGYQLLLKQANATAGAVGLSRRDQVFFTGAVSYKPLGQARLAFHGYQLDVLRAEVVETSYQGHSIYATLRDLTAPGWTNSLSLRSQLRLFDRVGALDWRNFAIAESEYRFTDWFSLRGEVIFLNSTASRQELTFQSWNTAVFSRFTL